MRFPVSQVRKGPPRPVEWCIPPETAVRQRDSLRPIGAATRCGHGAAPGRGGRDEKAAPRPVRRSAALRPASGAGPWATASCWGVAGGSGLASQRSATTPSGGPALHSPSPRPRAPELGAPPRQSRVGGTAQGKAGLGPRLGFGACCPTAPTGPPPHRMDRQQERAAVIPAQPGAPANIGQPGQPHPAPRRLASRVGRPELSRASEAQRGVAKSWTRGRQKARSASGCCRICRWQGAREGPWGNTARRWRWASREKPRALPKPCHGPHSAQVIPSLRLSVA